MRKRLRILVLAAVVAAIIVPLGFALSTESAADRATSSAHGVVPISQIATVHAHVPIVASTGAAVMTLPQVPEGAKLFAIGTALFGVAAAMRRTNRRV
jgi:hypothetical protein